MYYICYFLVRQITVNFQGDIIDYLPLTVAASVSPEVLLGALASCCDSSNAFDNLDRNGSTFHIYHTCRVSPQCELVGELSEPMLWRSFCRRLSRDEVARRCEFSGARWGGRIVQMSSHTGHSGNSSLQCASTRVFGENLQRCSSFRTLNREKLALRRECACAFLNNICLWMSWCSQDTRKAFCECLCVLPAVVSEGTPSHTLHTHELSQELL